jgi:hypothetical protein
MAMAGITLLARSLTIPYRYACQFDGVQSVWLVDIGENPFSGLWGYSVVESGIPGRFPFPYTAFVEPD